MTSCSFNTSFACSLASCVTLGSIYENWISKRITRIYRSWLNSSKSLCILPRIRCSSSISYLLSSWDLTESWKSCVSESAVLRDSFRLVWRRGFSVRHPHPSHWVELELELETWPLQIPWGCARVAFRPAATRSGFFFCSMFKCLKFARTENFF